MLSIRTAKISINSLTNIIYRYIERNGVKRKIILLIIELRIELILNMCLKFRIKL